MGVRRVCNLEEPPQKTAENNKNVLLDKAN